MMLGQCFQTVVALPRMRVRSVMRELIEVGDAIEVEGPPLRRRSRTAMAVLRRLTIKGSRSVQSVAPVATFAEYDSDNR
jgi:hypothetical protein